MIVYLDMDGVVVDFIGGVGRLFGIDNLRGTWQDRIIASGCNNPEYRVSPVLGLTEGEVWRRIEEAGVEFWRALEAHEWYPDLLNFLEERYGRVVYLSTPANPSSATGKIQWLRDRHGSGFRDYVLCAPENKALLAGPEAILVDDYPKNVEAFQRAGGVGILWPMPWNQATAWRPPEGGDVARICERSILDMAEALVHGNRGAGYGHPAEDFACVAAHWTGNLGRLGCTCGVEIKARHVPLFMQAVKISRELKRPKLDNRIDGAGYWETADMVAREEPGAVKR